MKQRLALVLAVLLCLGLVACAPESNEPSVDLDNGPELQSQAPSEAPQQPDAPPANQENDNQAGGALPPAPSDVQPAAGGYTFTAGSTKIVLGENINSYLPSLGEASNVFEAPSCAFEGIDKIYYFPGFIVNTFPQGENDLVYALTFEDDSVETEEGAYLGMTSDEIKAIYGESQGTQANVLSYKKGGMELNFIIDADKVIDVTYYYADIMK